MARAKAKADSIQTAFGVVLNAKYQLMQKDDRGVSMRKFGLTLVLLSAFFSFAHAQTPSPIDLLRMVKTLADSGRADDPNTIARTLHLSLIRSDHTDSVLTDYAFSSSLLKCQPTGHWIIDHYRATGTVGLVGLADITLETVGFQRCSAPTWDGSSGFLGIGSYPTALQLGTTPAASCITEANIKAIFPPPPPPPPPRPGHRPIEESLGWGPPAELSYSPAPHVNVGFMMADVPKPGGTFALCLSNIELIAHYPLGPLHKLDLKN